MATSKSMQKSKELKNDEFYTLFEDIADELPLYRDQLKGKRILCPCDWDESYDEALVYKEEGYIAPTDLLSTGGSVKKIDVEHSADKVERDLDSVKCIILLRSKHTKFEYYTRIHTRTGLKKEVPGHHLLRAIPRPNP